MSKRSFAAGVSVALVSLGLGAGPSRADFKSWLYDLSLGPYNGGLGYSYNVAYGYGLPFTTAPGYSYGTFPYYQPYRPPYPSRPWFRHDPPAAPADPPGLPPLVPVPDAADGSSVLEVGVPPDAEVWVDGTRTAQAGPDRAFRSPPLETGKEYVYVVRARWGAGGRLTEQIRTVPIRAGQRVRVDFAGPDSVPGMAGGLGK